MLEALKRWIGGILKFVIVKGNAALFASAQELLILYNLISFYEFMQKDANESEKIEDNLLLIVSIIASLPLILNNFCVACQTIDNTARQYIPLIGYNGNSHSPLDYVIKSKPVRVPLGFLGTLSWSGHSVITAILLAASGAHEKVIDWVFGLDTVFLDKMPMPAWVALLVVGSLISLPSEFFMRAGDLVESRPSYIKNVLQYLLEKLKDPKKTKDGIYECLFDCGLIQELPYPKLFIDPVQDEIGDNKIAHLILRLIQYVAVHIRFPLIDIVPYLYPILQLLNDVNISDDIKIGIGIALTPGFILLAINAWLTHAEAGQHYFGLEPNKWVNGFKKAIQLITAPSTIGLQTAATLIAAYRLLDEQWGLDNAVMSLSEDYWIPSPTILLTVLMSIPTVVGHTSLCTNPVNRMPEDSRKSDAPEEEKSILDDEGQGHLWTFENYGGRAKNGEAMSSPNYHGGSKSNRWGR
ncbi:MAG: hypothetical protein JSS53_05380 [Proteobacteria bacterium]|nr:hypothetical protein [Pseudomonadota bacterium]